MTEPTSGAGALAQKSDTTPALLGVACGLGAALFWALGFVATRHGLKVGFTPADLLMHRFLWSGLAFRSSFVPESVISAASDGAGDWR
jgi:drug/metabolite transporter (DMT)-like permease